MRKLFILALLALLPSLVNAAPNITSITWTGTLVDGATVTINGTGFGSTGPSVMVYDDFEGGTVGQVIATGAGSATYGTWSSEGSDGHSHYASSAAVSGTKALQADFGSGGFAPMVQKDLTAGTTIFYIEYKWYAAIGEKFPGELGSGNLNWKPIWLQDTGVSDGDIVLPATFNNPPQDWALFGNDSPFTSERYFDTYPTNLKGTWHHFMAYVKWGDPSNRVGEVDIWEVNSSGVQLMVSTTNCATQLSGDTGFNQVQVMAYGRTTASPSHMSFDDLYITVGAGALSRCWISNNSTFASATQMAVMTPTAWSATQITAIIRKSGFGSADTVNVIVSDSTGSKSSGYSVTLGATSGAVAATTITSTFSGRSTYSGRSTLTQ